MKRFFGYIILVLIILFFLCSAWIYAEYNDGEKNWQKYASAHDYKVDYIFHNELTLLRAHILEADFASDGVIADSLESLHSGFYESGLNAIPQNDGERYLWDFQFYIFPYSVLNPRQPYRIDNMEKRLEIANTILFDMPDSPFANKKIENEMRFLSMAGSAKFLSRDSNTVHYKTEENERLAKTAVDQLRSAEQTLNLRESTRRTLYIDYLFYAFKHAIQPVIKILSDNRPHCHDTAVQNYIALRQRILDAIPQLYAGTEMENRPFPTPMSVSKHSVTADALLTEKCGVSRMHMDKESIIINQP